MKRSSLFWQLYITYFVVVLLSLAAVIWYAYRSFGVIYPRIAVASIGIAAAVALINLYITRRIVRPLDLMKRGADKFASGDLKYRLPAEGPGELGVLSDTMNRMAEQLDERLRTITRQRNELAAILSNMVEGVLVLDEDLRVLRYNSALVRFFPTFAAVDPGARIEENMDNPDVVHFVRRVLVSDMPVEEDIFLEEKGGIYLRAHGTILKDPNGRRIGVLTVLHDLTRLKKLEVMRSEFVANVSHELMTPITAIRGFVETLQEGAIADEQNARSFLEIIERHTNRLGAIVEDLLSLSRIEQDSEGGAIQLTRTCLADVLESAALVCQRKAEDRSVDVTLDADRTIFADANPLLLEQAVINLVDNAVKYNRKGGGVSCVVMRDGDEAVIRVADQGGGIAPDHLPRIFERFYRVDKARSRKRGGTGLGLAIVKHVVSAHGGKVTVESELGRGSTFSIRLPLRD